MKLKDFSCAIVCLYRAPTKEKEEVDTFVSMLHDLIDYLCSIEQYIIIVGDTNVCMLTNDYRKQSLMECLDMFELHSSY